jgi:hypothetical protein
VKQRINGCEAIHCAVFRKEIEKRNDCLKAGHGKGHFLRSGASVPIHRPPAGGTMSPPQNGPHVPTSSLLQRLLREAPADYVTLGWLIGHLRKRSFGMVLLLLGVCALVPVISPAAGLLLAIPAVQMFRARPTPAFPRRLAEYRITTERLASVLRRVIPTLRYLERFIRPRWPTPFEATKRVVGGVVLLLGALLLTPIPLSNIPIGLTIVLVAFAYLEEDGVLLALALATAVALLVAAAAVLWGVVAATIWLAA